MVNYQLLQKLIIKKATVAIKEFNGSLDQLQIFFYILHLYFKMVALIHFKNLQ